MEGLESEGSSTENGASEEGTDSASSGADSAHVDGDGMAEHDMELLYKSYGGYEARLHSFLTCVAFF